MRKLLSFILFISCFAHPASAQNCNSDFLGTKTLYKKPGVKYTPVPAGYQPVFINHVSRHGARHLTKDVNTAYAYKLLMSADSAHALTAKGEQLRLMVIALNKIEKGDTKSISAEGVAELQGIGQRFYDRNSNVFKNPMHFNVALTKEIRTKQSADAFLSGLKKRLKDSVSVSEFNDDTDLRFYDTSPAYQQFAENGKWLKYRAQLEKAEHFEVVNKSIASKFFKSETSKKLNEDETEKFVADIFGFATIVYSLKEEIAQKGYKVEDVNFTKLFTCAELETLSQLDLADDYYKKGPGIDNSGIQVRIAVPLLVSFIKTSDEFIKSGGITAQLRFAHAETIAPIAALMNIAAADKPSRDISKMGKIWRASEVIPLSSNIQWIFYKKAGSPNYLVKILLNEKEVHISGLNNKGFPYYHWDDLRKLYLTKLNRLNVKLDDNMADYLTNVK